MAQIIMSNPQDAYKKQNILTASPVELIIMLYDGLRKNIVLGRRAIDKGNIENSHKYLIKAQLIVTELMNSLDMRYEMSQDMSDLYDYMLRTLEEANMSKNTDELEPLLEMIADLRDAWQTVFEQQKGTMSYEEGLG